MKQLIALALALALATAAFAADPLILHDGTPVHLRLAENLSSADNKTGESVDFEVTEDVKIGDEVIIKRASHAIGTVTEAQPKRRMGRTGKLDVTIDYVRMVNDEKALLRAVKGGNGGGHQGAMVGGMVATAIVFWPAAPLFLLIHGKDIKIPKGTEIIAFVNGDTTVTEKKTAQGGTTDGK
jgi:hypothetical protein